MAGETKRCAWATDRRLPIGFNSREALKEFMVGTSTDGLEESLKSLRRDKEIAEWRIELIEEVLKERKKQ